MVRCPICRARLNETALCSRCGGDLALPMAAEQQAREYYRQSIISYLAGDPVASIASVEQALVLKQAPLFLAWRHFLAHLCDISIT